ncbi:cytochrome P450 [Dichomitus squalens]|uniref:Cytochrome P450 n=1 Tax=Dichomitus squalens TaxID=114155 RepID=A0A4Q9PK28_9APHY|nr:cytochrome P450 [Dichomitus squalens]TBU54477.1 cytochrome P450 [Dichomitus squalens]
MGISYVWAEVLGLLITSFMLYRSWFAPLARLPGPLICSMTRLPLMYHEFHGDRRLFIHSLHMQYGPVVRVAPNEVSYATREAVKEIYASGGSGYDKSSFYSLFQNFETGNMFSTLQKDEHAAVKKQFAERYSKIHVSKPEVSSVIQENVDAFMSRATERLGASVDIYDLLHCFSLDGITGHLFHPSGLHSQSDPKDHKFMEELSYSSGLRRAYFRHYFPTLWWVYSKVTGVTRRRGVSGLVDAYVLKTAREATVDPHTVLDKLRTADARNPQRPALLSASECMDHLAAGIDTTGDGLCFLMHHLSRPTPASRRVQEKLREELVQHPGKSLDDLPYLDAVVKEGLRVFSPIPMSFPRVVPSGGRVVDGVPLPGGTIVSCQPYTLHRFDTDVFPDPDEFVPERWLAAERAAERNQLFFAFAAGGRGCIGKHLALLEMKLLLRDVYSTYRTRVAPDMVASMEQDDQTISSRPKGRKCLVTFEKLNDF